MQGTYIMPNARLDAAQVGIKISGRSISNLRYTDDTTLMAESEEELRSLLMTVKEEIEKAERERVGKFERMALKHVKYHV